MRYVFLAMMMAMASWGCDTVTVLDEPSVGNGGGGDGGSGVTSAGGFGEGGTGAGDMTVGPGGAGGVGGMGVGGAGGGELSRECQHLLPVTIDDVSLDDGPDDVWTIGETAMVQVTLVSPVDSTWYPGVRISHTTSAATPDEGSNFLFGLLANEPATIGVAFEAVQAGTITFAIDVEHINGSCPGADSTTFEATVP
jgi:hypothetical protein